MTINKISWTKLLFLLIALQVVINIIWLYINTAPPSWDAASHTTIAINIAEKLLDFHFTEVLNASNYYPILVHSFAAVEILVFGANIKIIQFTGTIFFVLGMVSLFAYVKELTGKPRVAFISTAIFSFCPIVFSESRRMMIDIPLTALVTTAFYLLLKSKNLKIKKYTFLFLICTSFVIMTKWTGIVFIGIPLIFSLISVVTERRIKSVLFSLVPGIIVAAIVVLPWYLTNLQSLLFLARINSIGELGDPTNLLSLTNLTFYLQKIINYVTTPLISIVFLVSIISFIRHKYSYKWMILLTLFVGYTTFTFIQNKDARYIIPLIPFIALTIGIFLDNLIDKYQNLSKYILYPLFCFVIATFLILTIRPTIVDGARISLYVPGISWVNLIDFNDSVSKKYDTEEWPTADILNQTTTDGVMIVVYETAEINPSTLSLYAQKRKYEDNTFDMKIITPDPAFLTRQFYSNSFPNQQSIENYLKMGTYVLISPQTTGVQDIKNVPALLQLRNYVDTTDNCVKYITQVGPANSKCFVREGQVFSTGSDIMINGILSKANANIEGSVEIDCPWGCSFNLIKEIKSSFSFDLVKEYNLPSSQQLRLYKITTNTF